MEQKEEKSVFGGTATVSEDIEERVQGKISRNFFLVCLAIIVLIIAVVLSSYLLGRPKSDNRSYHDEKYQERTITDKSKLLTIEKGSYFILFYQDGCAHCETVKPYVLDYLENDSNFDHNMYLSGLTMTIDPSVTESSMVGVTNYEDIKIVGYPTMFEVIDNKITNVYIGSNDIPKVLI